MLETLFIDGTDITTICPCIQVIDGLFLVPDGRGDNVVWTGLNGEVHMEKPQATGAIALSLVWEGINHDLPTLNDRYRQLKQLVKPGKVVQMIRRISLPSGTQDTNAPGEYLAGLAPAITINRSAKLTLSMKVLSGVWYGSLVTVSAPGTIVVPGDAVTRNMTVTMGPGALTNVTTGQTMTYSGTGTATINVTNRTAAEGATDTSSLLSWDYSQMYPIALNPGENTLTYTGTSPASITYAPAFY